MAEKGKRPKVKQLYTKTKHRKLKTDKHKPYQKQAVIVCVPKMKADCQIFLSKHNKNTISRKC